jgi:hypothetical protein
MQYSLEPLSFQEQQKEKQEKTMRKEYKSVELVDDIDGSPATATIEFGVGGKNYIIDLSEANAAAFNAALAPYIEHARRARRAPANKRKARSSSEAARIKRQRNAEIRAWALENGVTVSKRGQLGQDTIAAYEAAHAAPTAESTENSEN